MSVGVFVWIFTSCRFGTPSTAQPGPPLPSAYGYYVLDNSKLAPLDTIPVTTVFGLTLGNLGWAVDGGQNRKLVKIHTKTPTLIVYQQNDSVSSLLLSQLSFVPSMNAYEFNISKIKPEFFASMYKKDWYDTVPINLWRAAYNVPMRIEPVEGKMG